MKLTIFGATGGVGQCLVTTALDAGHTVTAFVRNASALPARERLVVVQGELGDATAVRAAIAGSDAVLSTLGARKNTPDQVDVFGTALTNITTAMKAEGVRRLVSISGAGVLLPGDHVTFGRRFVRGLMAVIAKYVARAKEREADIIRATDLEWVLVRPPRIVPGAATGKYRVLPDRVPSPSVIRGDLAQFMLSCVTSDEWVRRGPIPGK